jgi:hypothetical protein
VKGKEGWACLLFSGCNTIFVSNPNSAFYSLAQSCFFLATVRVQFEADVLSRVTTSCESTDQGRFSIPKSQAAQTQLFSEYSSSRRNLRDTYPSKELSILFREDETIIEETGYQFRCSVLIWRFLGAASIYARFHGEKLVHDRLSSCSIIKAKRYS